MLRFYDSAGEAHPLFAYKNLLITHKLDGRNKLSFNVDVDDDLYSIIEEECCISYADNEWIIKKIDDGKIECELNFDFLKKTVYKNYSSVTKTLSEVLRAHLPADWIIENANIVNISRSISFDYCTDYNVIMQCIKTYGVYFVWKITRKTITVILPSAITSTGEYFSDELNLKQISLKGESTNFATRLYCYGKDGLTFAEVNNGKEYIDNNTYSNKVICSYWSDDRYTDAAGLLEAGTKLLAELSFPVRSYDCDVIDIAKLNPEYSFLDIKLHKKITLIDRKRKTRIDHRIVEYKEYPDEPDRNVATLSSVAGTIQTSIQRIQSSMTEKILRTETALNDEVFKSTQMLLSALGGYVLKRNGELLFMDTDNPDTAEKLWRWNLNGLGYSATGVNGPYTTAITADGRIVADFISAGELNGNLIKAGTVLADSLSQAYKLSVTDEINNKAIELNQLFESEAGSLRSIIQYLSTALTQESDVRESSISELRQSFEQFSLSFSNAYTGGINLLVNSCGLNGLSDDWVYTGTVIAQQDSDTKNTTISNSCFFLFGGSSLKQTVKSIKKGSSYTLTLLCKKTAASYSANIKLIHDGISVDVLNTVESFGWKEISYTVANVNSDLVFEASCSFGMSSLIISDIMLVEGTTKARWTPAPNEVYTTNVKIDRKGINITNADSETETIIDNTQFAVRHKGETVITVNKDETRLKKSIVDSDLTIGKVKFLPKDNRSEGLDIILLD